MTLKLGEESQTDLEINRILVPTDLSDRSNAAIDVASSLAVDLGAELLLLHVNPVPLAFGETSPYTPEVVPTVEELKEQLDQVSLPHPELSCLRHVVSGDPAATIEGFTKQHEVDLIVMATHGRSGLSRWAYGSVAGKVLRGVSSPIFLVRTRQVESTSV